MNEMDEEYDIYNNKHSRSRTVLEILIEEAQGNKIVKNRTFYRKISDKSNIKPHHKLMYVLANCSAQKTQKELDLESMIFKCSINREVSL